ncbi:glycoside hydrolase family protein [Acetobacter peroxydans]|uniref:glycoside hydrolase family protein n=1 Tax=Acetobacter peroxydans TaxID=104098 RepID=UPI0035311AFA
MSDICGWQKISACVAKRPGGSPRIIKNPVDLTDGQQRRLLQVNLPSYEAIVRRGTHAYLTQNEFDALVSYAYNPGRGWPGVRAAINSGDKRKAVRIIEKQVSSKGKVLPAWSRDGTTRPCCCWKDDIVDSHYPEPDLRHLHRRHHTCGRQAGIFGGTDLQSQYEVQRRA